MRETDARFASRSGLLRTRSNLNRILKANDFSIVKGMAPLIRESITRDLEIIAAELRRRDPGCGP
jgi:hypothetical protein